MDQKNVPCTKPHETITDADTFITIFVSEENQQHNDTCSIPAILQVIYLENLKIIDRKNSF